MPGPLGTWFGEGGGTHRACCMPEVFMRYCLAGVIPKLSGRPARQRNPRVHRRFHAFLRSAVLGKLHVWRNGVLQIASPPEGAMLPPGRRPAGAAALEAMALPLLPSRRCAPCPGPAVPRRDQGRLAPQRNVVISYCSSPSYGFYAGSRQYLAVLFGGTGRRAFTPGRRPRSASAVTWHAERGNAGARDRSGDSAGASRSGRRMGRRGREAVVLPRAPAAEDCP